MKEGTSQPTPMGVGEALQLVRDLMDARRLAEAEGLVRRILEVEPGYVAAIIALAQILELANRVEEAVCVYEMAIRAAPSFGFPFTRRAVLLLRKYWGAPPAPLPRGTENRIACATLGFDGRFGNQLLQYAATRLYADKNELVAEFPDWVGRDLFDLDDPFIGEPLPTLSEENTDVLGALSGRAPRSLAGHNLSGYFASNTADYAPSKVQFCRLFRPGRRLASAISAWNIQLEAEGRTLVAVHLRRGDFGGDQFWIAPEIWYLKWLSSIWGTLERPLLYIATDDRSVLKAFEAYQPLTSHELGHVIPGAEFYSDFHALALARYLAISNSSFSFVAAMLNERATRCFRPEKSAQTLMAFDPWNAPVRLP